MSHFSRTVWLLFMIVPNWYWQSDINRTFCEHNNEVVRLFVIVGTVLLGMPKITVHEKLISVEQFQV